MKIVVIGSGHVAQALCKVIDESEMDLIQVFARNAAKAEELARHYRCTFTCQPRELAQADLYIMAVPDGVIGSLSAKFDFGDAVVVHTAGAVPAESLHPRIANRGVIYPLQTFTKWRDVDFRSTPMLIEGTTAHAKRCVTQFAQTISDCVKESSFEQRLAVHLAAVFANNFSNHMYTIGEEILSKAGLSFDLIKPLILETAHKAVELGAPRKVQTGPAASNNILARITHCDMLDNDLNYQIIYINLSNSILETLKKR